MDLSTDQIFEFQMANPLGLWLKGFGEDANGEIYVLGSTNLGPTGSTGVVLEMVPEPACISMLGLCAAVALLRRRLKEQKRQAWSFVVPRSGMC